MRKLFYFILLCLPLANLSAQNPEFALPSIISDHAVMQRNSEVRLWGWCPGTWDLKIVCSWSPKDTIHTTSDKYCEWETYIHTPSDKGPYQIRFYGWNNELVKEINDILMGETWLCSGQSNMEYCFMWRVDDAKNIKEDLTDKPIRIFKVSKASSVYPTERIEGKWEICSPETCKEFSVVAYYFGYRLNEKLQIPIGLIGSYWGGTCIEPWIPDSSYKLEDTAYNHEKSLSKRAQYQGTSWTPYAPSSIYNAMIYPIIRYTVAGVIWYQGEANNERAADYGALFNGLIRGWRKASCRFLPFYYVQIAPWNGYAAKNGAYLREQQSNMLDGIENVGMVSTGDLVNDISDIHPSLKKQVGFRLANLALRERYKQNDIQPYSPMLKSYRIKDNKVIINTTAIGKLVCKGKDIQNFELMDSAGTLYPAQAKILHDGSICVTSPNVKNPAAVRYCFSNAAIPNLFDSNNLPLIPFKTDKK